jgi:hypothetical protein
MARSIGFRNPPKLLLTKRTFDVFILISVKWNRISSCWEKCDEKCAYMFNVYKNQLSRQTGSRNLMGPKTLPTIWYTYMMLVTKFWSQASYRYPISWEAFLNPSESYFLFVNFVDFHTHWTYMLIFRRIFLSNCWWQILIFGHKHHIGIP